MPALSCPAEGEGFSLSDMAEALRRLKSVFGFDGFRPGQEEIVQAILAGRDVLAIMPTGGGKSLCYQLPALLRAGPTIVISPLIALMRDQVAALREAGVEAGALTSANDPHENARVFDALEEGRLKLLYMAPERLGLGGTLDLLRKTGASMLAVDEAHCVSQWGHDFRPDYLRIGELRAALGGIQTTAFTATADEATRHDIIARLFGDSRPEIFLRGFDRPNLSLAFEPKQGAQRRILDFVRKRPEQSGIIYTASRKRAETIATALQGAGVKALAYHAGLDADIRSDRQDRFAREDGIVMAATVAFGMGIDKPDIRFVIHADLPKTVESYYQEIGRAGRDGLPADTLTLYGLDDMRLRRRQIDESDGGPDSRRADHARLNALLALAEAPNCRRQVLLRYFGEEMADPCGNCDNCLNPPERHDGTVAVQKALSAMLRTGERFGVEHLIGVLRGEATDRIRQMGHDQIPTFGVGSDIAAGPWRGIFRQLYALGFAAISERGGWSVTDSGRSVLRGEEKVMLRREPERKQRAAPRENRAAGLAPHEQEIFESLRALRTDLARARNVPAYVIFNDASLIDMAERKPMDLDALAACYGVGTKKLAEFGDAFLQVLRAGTTERVHPARARLAGQPEGALMDRLRAAQAELSRGATGTDRYLSCTSATLAKIAEARPRDRAALERIQGMGPQKTARFADAFLAVLHEDA